MKNIVSKITKIVSVMMILLLLSMTACGKSSTTNEATNQPTADSREFAQERIEKFFDMWREMDRHTDEVLNDFVDNNYVVTPEFIQNIHECEAEFLALKDYSKTLTVEEYEADNGNKGSVRFNLEAGWVREPIWETSFQVFKYGNGWEYYDGVLTIKKNYFVEVDHMQNFTTKSDMNDYDHERVFSVKNSEKDAYLVLCGETGYQIIRIIAKTK